MRDFPIITTFIVREAAHTGQEAHLPYTYAFHFPSMIGIIDPPKGTSKEMAATQHPLYEHFSYQLQAAMEDPERVKAVWKQLKDTLSTEHPTVPMPALAVLKVLSCDNHLLSLAEVSVANSFGIVKLSTRSNEVIYEYIKAGIEALSYVTKHYDLSLYSQIEAFVFPGRIRKYVSKNQIENLIQTQPAHLLLQKIKAELSKQERQALREEMSMAYICFSNNP